MISSLEVKFKVSKSKSTGGEGDDEYVYVEESAQLIAAVDAESVTWAIEPNLLDPDSDFDFLVVRMTKAEPLAKWRTVFERENHHSLGHAIDVQKIKWLT